METENAPKLPDTLNGFPVVGIMRTPAGKGEKPHQAVVIADGLSSVYADGYQFTVWDLWYQDGAWHAQNGHYGLSLVQASGEFHERVSYVLRHNAP